MIQHSSLFKSFKATVHRTATAGKWARILRVLSGPLIQGSQVQVSRGAQAEMQIETPGSRWDDQLGWGPWYPQAHLLKEAAVNPPQERCGPSAARASHFSRETEIYNLLWSLPIFKYLPFAKEGEYHVKTHLWPTQNSLVCKLRRESLPWELDKKYVDEEPLLLSLAIRVKFSLQTFWVWLWFLTL